ncbi:hypothetical protein CSW98_02380 [Vibrio sp. HA2012]|uniref:hypothetical protein n=1 Tax=Vibrio sp. HA2012 TaxID=1971595 RepID=UPI000C2CB66F|nr:hypothetical protein [Vibrio sp. HA2012]PJC87987.1 hypothetical protein CSW98_02380 [Vibrio sp. HA2012]
MSDTIFASIIKRITSEYAESMSGEVLIGALNDVLPQQESDIEALITAKKAGELTGEEFDCEMSREEQILEAEMLTMQVASKAEVQKVVHEVFCYLSKEAG